MRNCYTYAVSYMSDDGEMKWYYGKRISSRAKPSELGKEYTTSSSHIHDVIARHGVDHLKWMVHRTFGDDEKACTSFESVMLRWLDARKSENWINGKAHERLCARHRAESRDSLYFTV